MSIFKRTSILLISVAAVIITVSGIFIYNNLRNNQIIEGVKVEGINVGGLTKEVAKNKLESLEEQLKQQRLIIKVDTKEWHSNMKDLGVELDKDTIVEQAFKIGREEDNWYQQWLTRERVREEGYSVPVICSVDESKLRQEIDVNTQELVLEARDAYFYVDDKDKVKIIPEKLGRVVDYKLAKTQLKAIVEKNKEPTLLLTMKETQPETTVKDIEEMGIKELISTYSTTFDAKNINRSYNIYVAAMALNDLLVKPEETVSFNEIVGPRSTEAGYKEAPIILNNELVPGIGGGVCQVSTTLYNCILLGNFEVIERSNHSMPVSYVPVGRDATVVYDTIDFKFRNNRQTHIYIKSEVNENEIRLKIFGNPEESKEIEIVDSIDQVIENQVIYQEDENLLQGQEVVKEKGGQGYRTTTVRLIKEDGKVLQRLVVSKSYYKPRDRVVAQGVKVPAIKMITDTKIEQESNEE